MLMNLDKNILFERFVSCVGDVGLLIILSQAAGCALAGGTFKISPVGFSFDDDFKPASPSTNKFKGRGIFRGKISRQKTQTNKNRLEEKPPSAPNS
jgi:hypothetical protein